MKKYMILVVLLVLTQLVVAPVAADVGIDVVLSNDNVVRGNPFSVTLTGEENASYSVYIGSAGLTGTETYPLLGPSQPGVTPYTGGAVPGVTDEASVFGTVAEVVTNAEGTRTVEFETSGTTESRDFDIKVVKVGEETQKHAWWKVNVDKGVVTIAYEGTGNYYMGEEITLTGTNTDSDNVYLYMGGPNLDTNGVLLTDCQIPVDTGAAAFTDTTVVETDNTWSFKWDTSTMLNRTDAGTYTVYAVASQNAKNALSGVRYATTHIVLKKPFVAGSASPSAATKGDIIKISGESQGRIIPTLALWIFGDTYASRETVVSNSDGTYSYDIDTTNMDPGQYYVIIQHPGVNRQLDVVQIDSSLRGVSATETLMNELNSPDIDDIYRKLQLSIENPPTPTPDYDTKITELEGKIAEQETKIATLMMTAAPTATATPSNDEVLEKLTELEEKIDTQTGILEQILDFFKGLFGM